MATPEGRKALQDLLYQRGLTLKLAAERIGRNHAYLQQFVKRGTPRILPEDVLQKIASLLEISEDGLRHLLQTGSLPEREQRSANTNIASDDVIPIFRVDPADRQLTNVILAELPRPPHLGGMRGLFGFHVWQDNPFQFPAGTILIAHATPARPGDFIVNITASQKIEICLQESTDLRPVSKAARTLKIVMAVFP